jgi:hypothetical protein
VVVDGHATPESSLEVDPPGLIVFFTPHADPFQLFELVAEVEPVTAAPTRMQNVEEGQATSPFSAAWEELDEGNVTRPHSRWYPSAPMSDQFPPV